MFQCVFSNAEIREDTRDQNEWHNLFIDRPVARLKFCLRSGNFEAKGIYLGLGNFGGSG